MPLILLGVGGAIAVLMGIWAFVGRAGHGRNGPDLGTISGQWIAERRAHERESSSDSLARSSPILPFVLDAIGQSVG